MAGVLMAGATRRATLVTGPLKISGRDVDWRQALCRDIDQPDRFHVDNIAALNKVTAAAIEVCNKPCPIKNECLQYALVNDIREGVWGGMTGRDRRKLQKGSAA